MLSDFDKNKSYELNFNLFTFHFSQISDEFQFSFSSINYFKVIFYTSRYNIRNIFLVWSVKASDRKLLLGNNEQNPDITKKRSPVITKISARSQSVRYNRV